MFGDVWGILGPNADTFEASDFETTEWNSRLDMQQKALAKKLNKE